jgi:hypothetical protein
VRHDGDEDVVLAVGLPALETVEGLQYHHE